LIEAKKIYFYDPDGNLVCIFYISMARANIIRISHGADFDVLPNNWQEQTKDALVAENIPATVVDGDIICPNDNRSLGLLLHIFKTLSSCMFNSIKTSYFVLISTSNMDIDVAYIYFMDIMMRSEGIDDDLRDLNMPGVDARNCVSDKIISVVNTVENDFEDVLRKVCETIDEYLPQIIL